MNLELDTIDQRTAASMHLLTRKLATLLNREFSVNAIEAMRYIVDDHRTTFKREQGFDFPELVPFYLPSVGLIVWYRADLDDMAIRNKLLMLLRQLGERGKPVSAIEVAAAVKRAWPRYHPPIEEYRRDPKLKMPLS
jgi:hypothetical protein